MSKVSYSAIVLNDMTKQRLINRFNSYIPEGWEIIKDMHMTINMGEIDPKYEDKLGLNVGLTVNEIATDDMVVAVGISGFESHNATPHIILAVNRENGGKLSMSNKLTNWQPIKRPMLITGKVLEVER